MYIFLYNCMCKNKNKSKYIDKNKGLKREIFNC